MDARTPNAPRNRFTVPVANVADLTREPPVWHFAERAFTAALRSRHELRTFQQPRSTARPTADRCAVSVGTMSIASSARIPSQPPPTTPTYFVHPPAQPGCEQSPRFPRQAGTLVNGPAGGRPRQQRDADARPKQDECSQSQRNGRRSPCQLDLGPPLTADPARDDAEHAALRRHIAHCDFPENGFY
jgi:hypothetical protein